mgnify:CR=1 FL=1
MGGTERSRPTAPPLNGQGSGRAAKPGKQFYFTIDCDWVPGSQVGLTALLDCCDRLRVKATIFFAGRFAEAYPDLVRESVEGTEAGAPLVLSPLPGRSG